MIEINKYHLFSTTYSLLACHSLNKMESILNQQNLKLLQIFIMSTEHELMMPGQFDRQYTQNQSDSQNNSNQLEQLQHQSSIDQAKQTPLTTFLTSQLDSCTINIPEPRRNTEKILHQNDTCEIQDKIYQDHRQFLSKYKKQRQQELKKSNTGIKDYKFSQPKSIKQKQRCYSMMQSSHQTAEENRKQNTKGIIDRMKQIHDKIKQEILSQDTSRRKPHFKLFTNVVEVKSDIGRINKEQRFIKSQQSKYLEYQEPKITRNNEYRSYSRVKTQGMYDQSQLSRQAQQFTNRIQKQQQDLLGNHLLRKRIQEKKRQRQQRQLAAKHQQLNQFKRFERKLKAQEHLMLMKHKNKIAQLINHKNQDQINHLMNQQKIIYNSRYISNQNQQNQFREQPLIESNRISNENNTDFIQPKRWKLQDLKLPAHTTHVTDREPNLREKIANKKNKIFNPKKLNRTQKKEDVSLDSQSGIRPLEKGHTGPGIENSKYPDSQNNYQPIKDQHSLKNRESSHDISFTTNQQIRVGMNQQRQKQRTYTRQKQESFSSMK